MLKGRDIVRCITTSSLCCCRLPSITATGVGRGHLDGHRSPGWKVPLRACHTATTHRVSRNDFTNTGRWSFRFLTVFVRWAVPIPQRWPAGDCHRLRRPRRRPAGYFHMCELEFCLGWIFNLVATRYQVASSPKDCATATKWTSFSACPRYSLNVPNT